MTFDQRDQAQEEVIGAMRAAAEALAFLRQIDPAEVQAGGPLKEQWLLQMTTLLRAHACLRGAADALYNDLTRFDEQMLAASDGDYTSLIEERQSKRGLTTVKEAGSRGGRSVSQKLGSAHFRSIGKLGGETLKEQSEPGYYHELGIKGGKATKTKFGNEHFRTLGKKGGASLKAQRGPGYYREIGQLGGKASQRSKRRRQDVTHLIITTAVHGAANRSQSMPAVPSDQQPTYVLWLVAVVYCQRDYKQARTLVQDGSILLNGQAVQDTLQVVRSADTLVWQNNVRTIDLDTLRKANALRRQIEGFFGGPEATYQRLRSGTLPAADQERLR